VLFAHDTEVALLSAAALVNTDSDEGDLLPDTAALDQFVDEWGWTGVLRHDREAILDRFRRLRPNEEGHDSDDATSRPDVPDGLNRDPARDVDLVSSEIEMVVDGHPVTFEVVSLGTQWLATAAHMGTELLLEGDRWPVETMRLVRVTDVEPYLKPPLS